MMDKILWFCAACSFDLSLAYLLRPSELEHWLLVDIWIGVAGYFFGNWLVDWTNWLVDLLKNTLFKKRE